MSGEASWPELASTDAHAHVADDPWAGWICIHRATAALTKTGRPSALLLHELAHILVDRTGHGEAWRQMAIALGAKREAAKYGPRPRLGSTTPCDTPNSPTPSPAVAPSCSTEASTTTSHSAASPS